VAVGFGSNLLALRVSRNLENATGKVATSFQRLSSGSRINKGSDDAAGLAISSSLNARSRIYGQSIRNISEATSRINVASSTVSGLSEIVNRLSELAQQASNGTLSGKHRTVINAEASALVTEYNRTVQSTQYQEITIIDGSNDNLSIRSGIGETKDTEIKIGQEMGTAAGDGTFSASTTFSTFHVGVAAGDINNDGKMDIVGDQYSGSTVAYLGNGDGTFTQSQSWSFNDGDMRLADFNNDGKLDVAGVVANGPVRVALGNGDGTFGATSSVSVGTGAWAMTVADLNNDGNTDIIGNNTDGTIGIRLGTGSGTFNSLITLSSGGGAQGVSTGDLNNDGNADIVTNSGYLLGRGDGTFGTLNTSAKGAIALDLNSDGTLDLVGMSGGTQVVTYLGNGDGTFKAGVNAANQSASLHQMWAYSADFTGDGKQEVVISTRTSLDVYKSNGNGTLTNIATLTSGDPGTNAAIADFNGDGTQDVIAGDSPSQNAARLWLGNADSSGRRKNVIDQLDLTSVATARSAVDWCRSQVQRLAREQGMLGASQSRLESQLGNLQGGKLESTEAASRITDADFAEEVSKKATAEILQGSSVALLAQANLQPQVALNVLRGELGKKQ
jgi:flagellin-like hook-associated protein FlgL